MYVLSSWGVVNLYRACFQSGTDALQSGSVGQTSWLHSALTALKSSSARGIPCLVTLLSIHHNPACSLQPPSPTDAFCSIIMTPPGSTYSQSFVGSEKKGKKRLLNQPEISGLKSHHCPQEKSP